LAGKHVLVEKPGAVKLSELQEIKKIALEKNLAVKVGFNHRFHPALLKTWELVQNGMVGEPMFLRARYGHGARVGYEKEWRSLPEVGGGGELLDQGVHILDLIYWFLGPLPLRNSFVATSFWNMAVDDNAVLTVANEKRWATFHVSCSEWKNTFSLELYGRTGKVLIQGLGGSYGNETLTYYKMKPEMGPPDMEIMEFDGPDHSWALDLKNLTDHLEKRTPLWGDIDSAMYALAQVRKAYQENGYTQLPASQ
jgi:predicted dehydrogenase